LRLASRLIIAYDFAPENLTIPDRVESLAKQREATMSDPFAGQKIVGEIKVTIKDVYGTPTLYPACDTAKLFAKLAGTKTITPSMVRTLCDAGYKVMQQREVQDIAGLTVL